ncbi:hypothetical protein AB0M95_00335 [Sphaerisporangium sp. NPDC051017]|uniref:hypothetical protein n=1 Tax=Sphaerisporangium sp. NPDC051017 TaxID=3154636 RepID=UPI003433A602
MTRTPATQHHREPHPTSPVTDAKTYTLLGPDRRPYESPVAGTLGGHRRNKIYRFRP